MNWKAEDKFIFDVRGMRWNEPYVITGTVLKIEDNEIYYRWSCKQTSKDEIEFNEPLKYFLKHTNLRKQTKLAKALA